VFDAPSLGDKVFEERQQMLRDYFESHHVPYVHLVEHVKCTGTENYVIRSDWIRCGSLEATIGRSRKKRW
jgi:hypothetical protein